MKYETLITLIKARVKYASVRKVAKQAKVSPATISRMQRGGVPDLATYFKLCKWLEVDAPFSIGFKK